MKIKNKFNESVIALVNSQFNISFYDSTHCTLISEFDVISSFNFDLCKLLDVDANGRLLFTAYQKDVNTLFIGKVDNDLKMKCNQSIKLGQYIEPLGASLNANSITLLQRENSKFSVLIITTLPKLPQLPSEIEQTQFVQN